MCDLCLEVLTCKPEVAPVLGKGNPPPHPLNLTLTMHVAYLKKQQQLGTALTETIVVNKSQDSTLFTQKSESTLLILL